MKNLTKLLFILVLFCAGSSLINAQAVPTGGPVVTDPTETQQP